MNLNLIDDVKEIIKKNTEEINKTGKGFNLLSILGMENNERYTHSNIIAELLNSKGSHTFGNLFFKLFLEELNIIDFNISNYEVLTEEYVKIQLGIRTFLDIVIKDKTTGKVILIENKIWAEDQPFQIERYYEAYKGDILKLFYLNVNEWDECPTTREEINNVFENISYKKNIKNWLANCIVASSQKPFINKQIEVYYETILKLSNQNIYKKMNKEVENKITENFDNFETAKEIANFISNLETEKINEFRIKIKNSLENGSFNFLDKTIYYEVKEDNSDFIFLGFYLTNSNDEEKKIINDENVEKLLTPVFGAKKMNESHLGWINSINRNDRNDIYKLCKDVDVLVEETKINFESKINQVKEAVNHINISIK